MSDPSALPADRVAGVLVGLAAGDALGAGYELGVPPRPDDVAMVGGGLAAWAPGEWTDDTQQAICVARVAATGVFDPLEVGERLLEWFRAGPRDVEIQTFAVLSSAGRARDLPGAAAQHLADHPDSSAGNGSLMRTAPVALAHLGDDPGIVDAAQAVSALTHADPLAGEACVLWCIAIDRAIRESRLDGARDGLAFLDREAAARWSTWLDDAEREPVGSFTPNGFVVRALQAAHAAIHQSSSDSGGPALHLEVALRDAVAIGHDTDTVAAIAGTLLGARYGVDAIPVRWQGLLHGWPGMRVPELVELAARAADPRG